MTQEESFSVVYAVPMHCEGCADSVKAALKPLAGIDSVETDLSNQLVSVHGVAAPSLVHKAIRSIGKDAIVRGTGAPNSAAVAILESFAPNDSTPVKGLARIISLPNSQTLFDISLSGIDDGKYRASIMESGDLSNIPSSLGSVYKSLSDVQVKTYEGQGYIRDAVPLSSILGRSLAITPAAANVAPSISNTFVGVVARSAGVWENTKVVCACSGKTLWEERADGLKKGLTGA